jgi:S1-C subfamily serine protease
MDAPASIPRAAAASVVHIEASIRAGHPSAAMLGEGRLGAGLAVAPDRVLTAHYIVMGASRIHLTGIDGAQRGVKRVAVDHRTGLALLSLEGPPLAAARLGQSDDVRPGRPVFVLSCTAEGQRRGAAGHVCAVGPFETFWEYMLDHAIMATVVNPGLAGAPLFDAVARVIGVVSLGLASVGRYSLAIPIGLFHDTREALEAGDSLREPRAWVGFFTQAFGGAILVSGVVPGGPADQAGVVRGDLIVSVAGRPVTSLRDLYGELWKRMPGQLIGFELMRESVIHALEVVAADRNAFFR